MPPKRATKATKTVMKAGQRPARSTPATKRKAMTKFVCSAAARRQAAVKATGEAKAKAKAKAKARAAAPAGAKAAKLPQASEKEERRLARLAAKAEEQRRRALERLEVQDAREAARAVKAVAALEAQEAAKEAARRAGERAKQMALEATRGRAAVEDPSIAAFREQFRAKAREVLGLGLGPAAAPEAPAPTPPRPQGKRLGDWKDDEPAEEELLMMGFAAGSA